MGRGRHREYLESEEEDTARHAQAEARAKRVQAELALVDIQSEPAGAVVVQLLSSGVSLLPLAGRGSHELPVGKYQVSASAPGYLPAQSSVLVQQIGGARLELRLVPLPHAVGRLLVSTGGVSAAVFIDGQRVAVTPATLEGVGVGKHTLEVRAPRRVSRRTVEIKAGGVSYVELDLESPAP